MPDFDPIAIEAVADAWASIDGKVDEFRAGKNAKSIEDEPGGYYSGYLSDAQELVTRLHTRGFLVVPDGQRRQERTPNAKTVAALNEAENLKS